MKRLWANLESWVTKHTSRSLRLRSGASAKSIAAAEKKLGLEFPVELRDSLLAHDGQVRRSEDDDPEESSLFEWLPGCAGLAPLKAIVAQWKDERESDEEQDDEPEVEGPVYNVMQHPRRIPIAGTPYWDGDNTYVDLFPAPKGKAGQIITFTSECDLVVLGSSLRVALETYLHALESGDWVFDDAKHFVRPKREKPDDFRHEGEEFAAYVKKTTTRRPATKKKPPAKQARKR